jgi:hypothetical protein
MSPVKKTILLLCVLVHQLSVAQPDSSGKNILKMKLLGYAIGSVKVQYERILSKKQSVTVEAGIFRSLPLVYDITYNLQTGMEYSAEYRYYFRAAPRGFYAAPFISYFSFGQSIEAASFAGGGLLAGAQWVFEDFITLDLDFGAGLYRERYQYFEGRGGNRKLVTFTRPVLLPALNLSLGCRF